MRDIQSAKGYIQLEKSLSQFPSHSLFHAAVVEQIVRQATQLVVGKVDNAQAVNGLEYILGYVGQVVVIKVDQLQLFGVLKGIKVEFVYPIVAQIQPLQMRHIAKDVAGGVLKGEIIQILNIRRETNTHHKRVVAQMQMSQ